MSSKVTQAGYKVIVDVEKINRLLTQLNDKEAKKAIKAALRKSILVIRKGAQSNLVSLFPSANKSVTKGGIIHKPLKNYINKIGRAHV